MQPGPSSALACTRRSVDSVKSLFILLSNLSSLYSPFVPNICRELLEDVKVRWLAGEQKRVCLQTSSGDVWLNLDQMWSRNKRKRKHL